MAAIRYICRTKLQLYVVYYVAKAQIVQTASSAGQLSWTSIWSLFGAQSKLVLVLDS